MSEIKVSLTIALQGSVMFSKEECLKTTQKVIERKTKGGKVYKKTINVQVENLDMMDKHIVQVTDENGKNPETLTIYTRKTKPATQSMNLCREAYEYMTSKECPVWSKIGAWNQMKPKQRLEAHLQKIAEHLGGRVLSYKVFED